MEYSHLSNSVEIKVVSEDKERGVFDIEGLYSGYGLTLGNALRRALLSSLPGAAVTRIKVKGVSHEFSTIPGLKEDIVELALNFKKIRFRMHTDEPHVLTLKVKGEREVKAEDLETDDQVEIMNLDCYLGTLTAKSAELDVEATVERGLGYSAVETRKSEKLPVGVIAVDAFFSPVVKANFTVENMRVGDRTDYNRLRFEVETDGSVSPSSALHKAAIILRDHFDKAVAIPIQEFEPTSAGEGGKKKGRAKK